MKKNKLIHIILVVLTLLIIALPAIQMQLKIFNVKKLKGVYHAQELPEFHAQEWFAFEYQPKLHKYLLQNYGFRPVFIRLFNQVMFSAFKETHENVTYGKEGFLYEHWFIDAYYGRNYIGDSIVESRVSKLSAIREALKAYNTELLVVLAPGKVNYWPEYVPDKMKGDDTTSNYSGYRDFLLHYNVPTMDVNKWFKEAKDTTNVPLFPKTGTHWSTYGAMIAFDSLVDQLSTQFRRPLPDMKISNIQKTSKLRDVDVDIEKLLNLYIPLDRLELSYPDFKFVSDSNTFKPKAIVISDSFFWNIFNLSLQERMFAHVKYWYYNKSIYPDSYKKPLKAHDVDLTEQVKNTDVFILMACPATIHEIGWGFIDRAYDELVLNKTNITEKRNTYIKQFEKSIRNTPDWLNQVKEKAKKKGVSLDSMIYLDAKWMANQKLRNEGYIK